MPLAIPQSDAIVLGMWVLQQRGVPSPSAFASAQQALADAGSTLSWVSATQQLPSWVTPAQFATSALSSLDLNASGLLNSNAANALFGALAGYTTAYPHDAPVVYYNLLKLLSGLEADATYGAAARAWNERLNLTYQYVTAALDGAAPTYSRQSDTGDQTYLSSGEGKVISARGGNDVLTVTRASDNVLSLGAGHDTVDFAASSGNAVLALSTGTHLTRIMDFVASDDHIRLSPSLGASQRYTSFGMEAEQFTPASTDTQLWSWITPTTTGTSTHLAGKIVHGAHDKAWLYIDNSNGVVDPQGDMLIELTGLAGTFTAQNVTMYFS